MRVTEFFEGDNGCLSMTRLLCFMSFFPSSYVVIKCVDNMNIDMVLGVYIGGYVLGYVGSKISDVWGANATAKKVQ